MAKLLLRMFDSQDISAVASETAVNKFEFPAERSAAEKKRPLGGRSLAQLLIASSLAAIASTTTIAAATTTVAAPAPAVTPSAPASWPPFSRTGLVHGSRPASLGL